MQIRSSKTDQEIQCRSGAPRKIRSSRTDHELQDSIFKYVKIEYSNDEAMSLLEVSFIAIKRC